MLLAPLRKERDEAYARMLTFTPTHRRPCREELDDCVSGNVEDFMASWYDEDEEQWNSHIHEKFYLACKDVKDAEEREYRATLAR
jgi:hypothetical protein